MSVTSVEDTHLKANRCIICHDTHPKSLYPHILKCRKCGHVFFEQYLNEETLSKLYDKRYFFGDEYHDYLADRRVLEKNFKLRLKVLRTFLDPVRHKSLLEIGCAYGFFLYIAKDLFNKIQGIDISRDGTLYAKEKLNLDVINSDFLKYDFGDEKFDVVCMWDTIEHLQNPDLYVEKISRHMESGALLALTTGDIDSVSARFNKDKWRLMHPPTHIHYFSKKTLARLLDNNGFDVVYNSYCGFHRSVDIAAYRMLALSKRRIWFYNFLRKTGLTGISFYLNLYDITYVIARRR